jgi:hypothetical protein
MVSSIFQQYFSQAKCEFCFLLFSHFELVTLCIIYSKQIDMTVKIWTLKMICAELPLLQNKRGQLHEYFLFCPPSYEMHTFSQINKKGEVISIHLKKTIML